MARKIGLGKGLDALLENNDDDQLTPVQNEVPAAPVKKKTNTATYNEIPVSSFSQPASQQATVQLHVEKLVANPGQPRKNFNETELNELAESIKTYGIIQPIIAANAGDGTYIIIAGERRTRAARLAGLRSVPVIIREYTDQKRLEISLIENIQRADLNPIEEAAAYKNLMDYSNISQDELAARMGKNRSTVANALRLLRLPVEIQKSIEEGKVSSGHARALLSVTNSKARDKLYNDILKGDISVRAAEKRAALINTEKTDDKDKTATNIKKCPPEVEAMAEKFIGKLGTKVVIDGDLNKGKIHIDYYSMEDLDRLYEILGN
ncbi:MAG: ParB/RepB/Spo0J family partition protein [Treponema sp.]|nr:ParB/RepB/Spo0J family partition protein [Treponema sp.]